MADFIVNKKKIAQNTLFLYSRMLLVLVVNFYTIRVLLQVLGIQDYGIFTIAMGITTMFSILCNAMARTTQRFLSIAIVEDEKNSARSVFSICLLFFLGAALVLIVLAETVGLYLFKHKIQIPVEKMSTALFVYQMSILCVIASTLTIPFMSSVIAKEQMSFLAKIGIVEALQKLAIALLLQWCCFKNALIAYSLMMIVSLWVIFGCYFLYCRKNFVFCRLTKNMDTAIVKKIFNFSGWSLWGSTANLLKTQGINVILNLFHGINYNTTWGVTTQIAGGLASFIYGFQQAFNPEILKSQANKEKETFWDLLFSSAKYSYLLLWLLCSPIIMNLTYLLQLWLGKSHCPPQIELFIIFALIFFLLDCFSGPLWTTAEAIGNIMFYQLIISGLMIGGVVVSYLLFSIWQFPAYAAIAVNAIINALCLIFRLFYLKAKIQLCIHQFCREVFLPTTIVTLLSICTIFLLKRWFTHTTFYVFLLTSCILTATNLFLCYTLALNKGEKEKLFALLPWKAKRA